jgi:hypothetical protein
VDNSRKIGGSIRHTVDWHNSHIGVFVKHVPIRKFIIFTSLCINGKIENKK